VWLLGSDTKKGSRINTQKGLDLGESRISRVKIRESESQKHWAFSISETQDPKFESQGVSNTQKGLDLGSTNADIKDLRQC
jgi:hypothetical protein